MISNVKLKRKIVPSFFLLIAVFLPYMTPYKAVASEVLIFALFAMAYNVVLGNIGMLSFGHAAFFGLGAYGTGITLLMVYPSTLLALSVGVITGSLGALVIGFLSIGKRGGFYFAMLTLALSQVFYFIAFEWRGLTGGDDGLHGIPRLPVGPLDLTSEITFYYFTLLIVVLSTFIFFRLNYSPFGKTLQAIRENKNRAISIGYDINKYRLIAFVISGFFSALAGGLYTLLLNFVPISSIYWVLSGDVVMMVLVGGMYTLFGPAVGAVIMVLVKDILATFTESWSLIIGLLFIVCVFKFRSGILGFLSDKTKLEF